MPSMVSQLTSEPALGINARRFLTLVVPLCKGHVVSVGKLRLVPTNVVLEKLRALAANGGNPGVNEAERQPETAAEAAAALGWELT